MDSGMRLSHVANQMHRSALISKWRIFGAEGYIKRARRHSIPDRAPYISKLDHDRLNHEGIATGLAITSNGFSC